MKASKDKTKATTKTVKTTSDVERKPDGTATFKLTIPKENVATAYKKALEEAVKITEIEGFRKGKAPEHRVAERVGKQKLYTQTLQHLLPVVYAKAVNALSLKPITSPRVEPESLEEGQDWHLKVTVAEKPDIRLGDYKKAATAALTSGKIWVPGKDAQPQTQGAPTDTNASQPQQSTDERISKVFEALLSSIEITPPEMLVEDEVNRQLSRMVQQLEKLNLTVDQYLASLGKTSQELRKEYRQQAERTLKLELILNEIAEDMKVSVADQEVDEMIKAVGDEKLRRSLDTPTERTAIRASLRKRKVIDNLLRM